MLGPGTDHLAMVTETALYFVDGSLNDEERDVLRNALVDSATQSGRWVRTSVEMNNAKATGAPFVEVCLRPGVTDPTGAAFSRAAALLGLADVGARAGSRFSFDAAVEMDTVTRVADALLHNEIVDEVSFNAPIHARFVNDAASDLVEIVPIRGCSDDALAELSVGRGLALDPEELVVVRDYFSSIGRDPTDAEIETIAQTWSEHCSHKTFRADITWADGTVVEPLLKQLGLYKKDEGAATSVPLR